MNEKNKLWTAEQIKAQDLPHWTDDLVDLVFSDKPRTAAEVLKRCSNPDAKWSFSWGRVLTDSDKYQVLARVARRLCEAAEWEHMHSQEAIEAAERLGLGEAVEDLAGVMHRAEHVCYGGLEGDDLNAAESCWHAVMGWPDFVEVEDVEKWIFEGDAR